MKSCLDDKPKKFITPDCCLACKFYAPPERGEFGMILGAAYCKKNIWIPTKKKSCKRFTAVKSFE